MVSSYQGHLQESTREESPKVRDFMSHSFVRVAPDEDVYKAMGMILKERVSGAVVADSSDKLLGIVTEKDFLKLAALDTYDSEPTGGPVSAYMSKEVITATPEMAVSDVAEMFLRHHYRKLPVVEEGRVIGMVRRHDVLIVIEDFYKRRMAFVSQR